MARREPTADTSLALPDPYIDMSPEERRIAEEVWPQMPRRPLTTAETVEITGMSRRSVERLWQKHRRPHRVKLPGGGVRYQASDVLRLISGTLTRELQDQLR